MFSLEELKFAQKYPFSSATKAVVKQAGIQLDNVDSQVVLRARAMVLACIGEKTYKPMIFSSKQLLEQEVLAFPVAKIIVSFSKDRAIARKFAAMIAKRVFLDIEKEKKEVLEVLSRDLLVKAEFLDKGSFFAKVLVPDFLLADFSQDFMKLVNQRVFGGFVFLSRNEFARFLAYFFENRLLRELPVDTKGLPKIFEQTAKEITENFHKENSKKFENVSFGPVKPVFFPPCIEKLYSDILFGRNLSHSERFVLATFMLSIGAPEKNVVNLYRSTPNFDEKITTYQVSRLAGSAGKKISAASCRKMAEYSLRLQTCPCLEDYSIKHPIQFYQRGFFSKKNGEKNSSSA